ncbi:MAG: hypothetical protein PHU85_07845 [Phycisphaerae bacterium]|nr:hypothetical protein [Phycisphaerae bacterium]
MNAIDGNMTAGSPQNALRQRVNEFVGLFFYGTLLKGMRDKPMTDSKMGLGGRGEQAFGAQLDQELAQRAGRASNSGLNEAIVRQLSGKLRGGAAGKAGPAIAAKAWKRYDAAQVTANKLDVTH